MDQGLDSGTGTPGPMGAPARKGLRRPSARRRTPPESWTAFLESTETIVYAIVGVGFLVAAALSLAYSIFAFVYETVHASGPFPGALLTGGAGAQNIIALVSDLLLTLIIMEVMGTVLSYLRHRAATLKPFLFIGIVSATRGILAVGARLAINSGGAIPEQAFRQDIIELGVNAAVIIALGVAMKLIGGFLDDSATPPTPRVSSDE
jgi:uncharacterized membrane protein (DUF373 family)